MTDKELTSFLAARRQYIASQFSHLNDMQLQAALTTQGPLLLLAGAGSGKTTVLINRIANLIRFGRGSDSVEIPDTVTVEDLHFLQGLGNELSPSDKLRADALCALEPAAPWSILAITFTNKAANTLKDRLSTMLGSDASDIWAMTFHSACCRILRKDIERLGFGRDFTIYDTSDSERVLKGIIEAMGLEDRTFPPKYVLSVISKQKNQMVSPEDMLAQSEYADDYRVSYIARIYDRYTKTLHSNNALDFDDIIYHTVRLLNACPDVLSYYQTKFRYILVDEYQDTNYMQYLLIALLAGKYQNLCVVGDDDQSIYRFRGATIENILSFEDQYPSARTIRLEQNYRSTQSILNAANAVIANNLGRKGKRLWTANAGGEPITVYEAPDETAEANYVASEVIRDRSKGISLNTHAILYRTNSQSNAMEQALRKNGIPYRVFGGMRFFDRAEIKDMLAYLCVINNRNDDLRLRRIINNPPRGIGQTTITNIERLALAEGKGLYAVLSQPEAYASLQKSAEKLRHFSIMIEEMAQLLDTDISLTEFYEILIRKTGYEAMLAEKPTVENQTKLDNIRELTSSIQSYIQNAEQPTLSGFLEEIALYTDIEQYNEDDDAVVMMTMHAAKGLEFPYVFMVGLEEGLFPGMRAIGDSEEMEEERRLCYVAITRAKKKLSISYARSRMLYGKTNAAMPSRFVKELPEELVEKKGGYQIPADYTRLYYSREYTNPPVQKMTVSYTPKTEKPMLSLSKGDMVRHTAFGRGMVLSVLKMGGDALLEIAFDDIGTKKLMAKTASAHMEKL